ncbi:MAG: HNH endonuclease signature motif containing protein [Acidimicrobiales bacterium]
MHARDAAELLKVFAELEHLCSAGRLLVTAKATESATWSNEGHRSAASWIAAINQCGFGRANEAIDTAQRLQHLPATSEALRRGQLSEAQASAIASAACVNPTAEAHLLEAASQDSFKDLKERCRNVKLQSRPEQCQRDRAQRIHNGRYARVWSDEHGAVRLDARLTPEVGAQVIASLEACTTQQFEEASAAGVSEPNQAYRADALAQLCSTGGTSKGRDPDRVHLRVDLAALRRGRLDEGELCEIPGVGPVSLATAKSVIGDAWVKVLVTDGVDVTTVAHVGRTIPAHVRSALYERDPVCVVPGCGSTWNLEIDHWKVDYAECGSSELDNLCRLCRHHHRLKTHGDFTLMGGPGKWEFRQVDHSFLSQPF